MASRLFQSVVVSSVLLLSGVSSTGCANAVGGDEDAPSSEDARANADSAPSTDALPTPVEVVSPDASAPADVVTPRPDVIVVADASRPDVVTVDAPPPVEDASAADVLADERAMEVGWPTTKAHFCNMEPASGPGYCCSNVGETPTCCVAGPDGPGPMCAPCTLDNETGVCTPNAPSGG